MIKPQNKYTFLQGGVSTPLVMFVIVLIGVAVGGLFYFVGSQSGGSTYQAPVEATPPAENTGTVPSGSDISASSEDSVLSKEIEETTVDSTTSDFADIDKDTTSLQ